MAEIDVYAGSTQLRAVYVQGKLLLAAQGMKQGPQSLVRFEQISLTTEPPLFALRHRDRVDGLEPTTPYQIVTLFSIGPPCEEVIVRTGDEEHRLPVLVAADPEALDRREPVSLVRMGTMREVSETEPMPQLFSELLDGYGYGDSVPTPIVWPMRLGPLFDGRIELAPAEPRRATGYSDVFDFREAFLDALRSLPPEKEGCGDKLTTVQVTETGALVASSGHFQRLFVSVLAY